MAMSAEQMSRRLAEMRQQGVIGGRQMTNSRDPVYVADNDLQELEVLGANEVPGEARRGARDEAAISRAANREGLSSRVAEARSRASRGRDVAEGIFERQTRGMDLSERQKAAATKRLGLTRMLSRASASGGERRTAQGLVMPALRGQVGLEQQIFGQELSGLTQLANAEGQRRVNAENKAARKKSERNSMIGTGLSIAAAIFASSEQYKDKRGKPGPLLDKLKKVRVERWNYKGDNQEHIGAFSEEFNDTFGVNQANRDHISLIDAVGVTMGALKELNQKVEALNGAR